MSATDAPNLSAYTCVEAVDKKKLQGMGVDQAKCQAFIASQQTAELNLIEFFYASSCFPIAFVRQKNNDFRPFAILGLKGDENLFLDDKNQWLEDIYQPAYLRRFPFITESVTSEDLDKEDNDLSKTVFVVPDALCKSEQSLFIGNDVATQHWHLVENFIAEYISAEKQTLLFSRKLEALKLLKPFDAQIHPKAGESVTLKGLYRVDEDSLNNLSPHVIKELMQCGWLSRIYAHLISLEKFASLLDRRAKHEKGFVQQI